MIAKQYNKSVIAIKFWILARKDAGKLVHRKQVGKEDNNMNSTDNGRMVLEVENNRKAGQQEDRRNDLLTDWF